MQMEPATVSILGLGAEGSIAFQALMGMPCQVRILARGERARRLQTEGITINGVHHDLTVSEPGAEDPPQLLIVSVKSYQLAGALEDVAAEVGPDTVVMSLMNGLTSEEILAGRVGADHLIYCMSRLNAKKIGQNVVFQPVGAIYIGERDGTITPRLQVIHDLLDGEVSCQISQEILVDIWRKYLFNTAFNTVESVLRCRHKWFQELTEPNLALECIMQEIVRLANACDIPLSDADIRALDGYCMPYPSDGMCSMAQDLQAKRPTEIDMLIGEALELGRSHKVELPVCQFVYHLVRSLEQATAAGFGLA